MQTTSISLPKQLAKEVETQIKEGRFASRSEFFRAAVKTYLSIQNGQVNWEVLATPFRSIALKKDIKEKDILKAVEKGRHAKKSSN